MIRLSMTVNGRRTVVLGLDAVNLRRMQGGEPIKVNLRDLDPDGPPTDLPDIDVMIGAIDTDDWRRFAAGLDLPEVPQ